MSGTTIRISLRRLLPIHDKDISLQAYFDQLGEEFYSLYCSLQSKDPIEFSLTAAQQAAFNAFFARMQDKYLVLQGLEAMASVRP